MNLATILSLTRPLAVLDLETTGLYAERDRVVQIGLTIHYPTREPISWQSLVNPEIKIPKESLIVHKITDEMVADAPTFKVIAPALAPKLTKVDFLGYNVHFDLKFLRAEMKRAGVDWDWEVNESLVIDALKIFRLKDPRNLEAAFKKYVPEEDADFGAHDAGRDVAATAKVFAGQLKVYKDLPKTIPELADVCFPKVYNSVDKTGKFVWKDGKCCINFGKFKDTPLDQLNSGYMKWVLSNDFPADVKEIMEKALIGQFPVKN